MAITSIPFSDNPSGGVIVAMVTQATIAVMNHLCVSIQYKNIRSINYLNGKNIGIKRVTINHVKRFKGNPTLK